MEPVPCAYKSALQACLSCLGGDEAKRDANNCFVVAMIGRKREDKRVRRSEGQNVRR